MTLNSPHLGVLCYAYRLVVAMVNLYTKSELKCLFKYWTAAQAQKLIKWITLLYGGTSRPQANMISVGN